MTQLHALTLDTSLMPPEQRLSAWRAAIPQYEIEPDWADGSDNFGVIARAWFLGDLVVTHTVVSAATLSRSPALIAADGADTYNLNIFLHGTSVGEVDGQPLSLGPGQLVGYDLSRPFSSRSTACECVSLVIGRGALQAACQGEPALHGRVFDGAAGLLLSDHCLALARHLPGASMQDAGPIVQATLALIVAALSPSGSSSEANDVGQSRLRHEIRRYIDRNLGAADLDPETIGQALDLSRSQLYRIFQPLGGISAFIQRRRLQAVRALLLHPSEARSIAEVARAYGFVSNAHFAAAFRKEFGCSPRELCITQRVPAEPGEPQGSVSHTFQAWLARLGTR